MDKALGNKGIQLEAEKQGILAIATSKVPTVLTISNIIQVVNGLCTGKHQTACHWTPQKYWMMYEFKLAKHQRNCCN